MSRDSYTWALQCDCIYDGNEFRQRDLNVLERFYVVMFSVTFKEKVLFSYQNNSSSSSSQERATPKAWKATRILILRKSYLSFFPLSAFCVKSFFNRVSVLKKIISSQVFNDGLLYTRTVALTLEWQISLDFVLEAIARRRHLLSENHAGFYNCGRAFSLLIYFAYLILNFITHNLCVN